MFSRLTLAVYLLRNFMLWFALFLLVLSGVIFLFEVAELLRRAADIPAATLAIALKMALYKMPETVARVLPFVTLFAAMFTFWRMTRSQELVIMRASGVSVWQFLAPIMLATLVLGYINTLGLNIIGADMTARYWAMEATYLNRPTTMELTGAGLWLRQQAEGYEFLFHADSITLNPMTLRPVLAIVYDPQKRYIGRIDGDRAVLQEDGWIIADAWYSPNRQQTRQLPAYRVPSTLTTQKIQESMAAPDTVSFWKLPEFIKALQAIGLPTIRHQMVWHGLLAAPLMLAAMTMFAAGFSLRLTRRGGTLLLALGGVVVGSLGFAFDSVLQALGTTQTLPVVLAAWAPPLLCLTGGMAALLYLEDG